MNWPSSVDKPKLRENFTTDNGNIIIDVANLTILDPTSLEARINQIPGVVCNGLFAAKPAHVLLIGDDNGVRTVS